jgi:hypothetical protein
LLAAGELRRVAVPSVEEEALRDLVRAREDLRGDLMRARHRLAKLLLRHEIRFDGPQANWTQAHLGWLAGVRLAQPASQRALEDYRGEVAALMIRREQLEAEIARALPESPWAQTAAQQAPHHHRGRRRARARRVVLGGRDRRLTPVRQHTLVEEAAGEGPSRQSIRDTPMGNRP